MYNGMPNKVFVYVEGKERKRGFDQTAGRTAR